MEVCVCLRSVKLYVYIQQKSTEFLVKLLVIDEERKKEWGKKLGRRKFMLKREFINCDNSCYGSSLIFSSQKLLIGKLY